MSGYTRTRHWTLTWAKGIQSTYPHHISLITCIYLCFYKWYPVIHGLVSQLSFSIQIFQLKCSRISRFFNFSPLHFSCFCRVYAILQYCVVFCRQELCPGIFQLVRVPAMDHTNPRQRRGPSVTHDIYTPICCACQFRVTNVIKPMFYLCFVWKMMKLRF